MTRVVILSGISGSGKTTMATRMCEDVRAAGGKAHMMAADDWFMKNGEYRFDVNELGYAHGYCYSKFMSAVEESPDLVVVHNTNASAWEISPYVLFCTAHGIEAEVITIECDANVAAGRNTHGLGVINVVRQLDNLRRRQLPKQWKTSTVRAQ